LTLRIGWPFGVPAAEGGAFVAVVVIGTVYGKNQKTGKLENWK
jgi:hypothetical protein